jgi:dihydrofolate reductase
VIIGGTQTVSEFLKAGLVNELILVVEPVLFNTGLPLLKDVQQDFKLSLSGVKQLNNNSVELHYKIEQ